MWTLGCSIKEVSPLRFAVKAGLLEGLGSRIFGLRQSAMCEPSLRQKIRNLNMGTRDRCLLSGSDAAFVCETILEPIG